MAFDSPEEKDKTQADGEDSQPELEAAELSTAATPQHAMLSMEATGDAPATSDQTDLAVGERLAGRFRIVRFIAKGGMGEVYEAEDEVLRVRLALKTMLPAIAADPVMVEQLKLEMRSARKVTHPNVCRLIEVFQDEARTPPLVFLTMELVKGETLAEYLRREGPLPFSQFFAIAAQIAEGLDAVHNAGLVHQDFKTSNVMLVKSGDSLRALVTDFGLAVNLEGSGRDRGLSGGTLAYMAPEQVEDKEEIGPAADVYAYGVVLYELLTNRFPIAASSRKELQERKLSEKPIPPSHYRADIPKYAERAILKCLERRPEARFASTLDVVAAVEGRAEKRRRKIAAFSLTLAILFVIAIFGGYAARRYFRTHRTPTIAVVGLQGIGSEANSALGTELTEMLSSNLAQSKGLNTVPSADVSLAQGEFPLTTSGDLARADLSPLRVAMGADYLVMGRFNSANDRIQLELTLQDSAGASILTVREDGTRQESKTFIADAAKRVRQKLGTQLLSDSEIEEVENIYPQNDDARRLYFEGMQKLRALNAIEATALFQKAEGLEPENAVIHAGFAEALNQLKNMPAAREQAQRAEDLARSGHLPPEFVAITAARSAELRSDWKTAIQKLDGLFTLGRESLHYGLLLSAAQNSGGEPNESLKTLASLGKLPAPARTDPRIPLTAAQIYSSMGRYRDEIASAERALKDAQARSWRMMEAQAYLQLCWAYQRNGELKSATEDCNAARQIFAAFGDGVSGAVTLNNIANQLVSQGKYEDAKAAYERVLKIVSAAQSPRDIAGAQLNLANTYFALSDYGACRQHLEAAIEVATKASDSYDESRARIILAEVDRGDGNLSGALDQVRRARDIAHASNDADAEGYALNNLALYLEQSGDLSGAFTIVREALAVRKALGIPSGISNTLSKLGDMYFVRGDLDEAKKSYEEALSLRDPAEKSDIALLQLSLANVQLEMGELGQVLTSAKAAAQEFENEKDADDAADADALLVRIFIRKPDLSQARDFAEALTKTPPQDHDIAMDAAIARAELLIAEGHALDAATLLQPVVANTQAADYQALEAEWVLARAELSVPTMRTDAIARLRNIQVRAAKAGFRRLATKVRETQFSRD